jgi:hypothetical protein
LLLLLLLLLIMCILNQAEDNGALKVIF